MGFHVFLFLSVFWFLFSQLCSWQGVTETKRLCFFPGDAVPLLVTRVCVCVCLGGRGGACVRARARVCM